MTYRSGCPTCSASFDLTVLCLPLQLPPWRVTAGRYKVLVVDVHDVLLKLFDARDLLSWFKRKPVYFKFFLKNFKFFLILLSNVLMCTRDVLFSSLRSHKCFRVKFGMLVGTQDSIIK